MGLKHVYTTLLTRNKANKWSKQFDIRPHHCRPRRVQSYSSGGANVHAI